MEKGPGCKPGAILLREFKSHPAHSVYIKSEIARCYSAGLC